MTKEGADRNRIGVIGMEEMKEGGLMRDTYAFYTDKLQGEYKDAFQQIEMYMDGKACHMEDFEDRMMELLDVFLSAQEKGRSVTSITGRNMEQFCKNFCEEISWRSCLRNLADLLKFDAWWLLICLFLELPFILEEWEGGWKRFFFATTEIDFGAYFLMVIVSWIVLRLFQMAVRYIMFKVKWLSWRIYISISIILIAGLFAGGIIMCFVTDGIGMLSVPVIPTGLICGGYLLVYYRCNRKEIQEKRRNKVKFTDMVKNMAVEDAENGGQMTDSMKKQFERKNRWRKRRGKELWNWEEYICFLEKDEKSSRLILKSYFIFPILLAGFFTFLSWSSGESVTWAAIGGCFLLVLAVCYVIFMLLYHIIKCPFQARWAWIHKQRELLEKQKNE